jgi:2-keto-4-pentenoate hydratase/2-oxohepta-3-ene-1,7-dioic acid hydratase in catechol pathway
VKLLVPCEPTKIVGIGLNYAGHIRELGREMPELPHFGFLKPHSALIAQGEAIVLPNWTGNVRHEGELAIVIGKRAKHVSQEAAREYIFGFTCANDVTAGDLAVVSVTRGKGFDTFCPLGPWIETDLEADNVGVETKVNGKVRQHGSTRDMVFSVPAIVSHLSQVMTLNPGDVVLTGTPEGVGPLTPGDVVEVTIEGIGTLRNPVKAE